MSTKFTPGPWTVGAALNGNWIEFGADEKAVARTFHTHVGAQAEDANAHLIAAAPDLYEALAECRALLDGEGGMPVGVRERADAALAKARGEQA